MDLRHRHGDAAAHASEGEQTLGGIRSQAQACGLIDIAGARRFERSLVEYRPPQQNHRERQHRCQTEYADADMGLPPTDLGDEMLDDWWPDHAGKGAAGSRQGNGEAAVPVEP